MDVTPGICTSIYEHIRHEITLTFEDGPYWFTRTRVIQGLHEENRYQTLVFAAQGYYGDNNPWTVADAFINVTSTCEPNSLWSAL